MLMYKYIDMITRYPQGSCTWVDLASPTAPEIREVMEQYGIPPALMADFNGPTRRGEASLMGKFVKVTLDFPVVKLTERERSQEIKFLVSKKVLITARYGDIPALHQFAKEFEVITTLKRAKKSLHGGNIFIALMDTLYDALDRELDSTETLLDNIEEEIFREHEREMVVEISRVSQRLITFRQILLNHEDILKHSQHHFEAVFPKAYMELMHDLEVTFDAIARHLSALTASVVELRETNNSLVSTKQNEVTKILTIMAFVTFPLSLFASLFGMNVEGMPLVGVDGGFWIIIAIMTVAAIGLFTYFKYKRWM